MAHRESPSTERFDDAAHIHDRPAFDKTIGNDVTQAGRRHLFLDSNVGIGCEPNQYALTSRDAEGLAIFFRMRLWICITDVLFIRIYETCGTLSSSSAAVAYGEQLSTSDQ